MVDHSKYQVHHSHWYWFIELSHLGLKWRLFIIIMLLAFWLVLHGSAYTEPLLLLEVLMDKWCYITGPISSCVGRHHVLTCDAFLTLIQLGSITIHYVLIWVCQFLDQPEQWIWWIIYRVLKFLNPLGIRRISIYTML